MVDIKDIQGNILFSTPINEGSKRKFTLQKEDYIALKFSVDNPIYFKLGDGIDDDNIGLFELVDLYKPTYNESTGGYDYELQLDAYYWKWKNKIFKFKPESGGQEAAWNLTASLDVHLGIFLRNLKSLSYTYRGIAFEFSIDSTVENSSKLVSYDSTNMIDALTKMAETWECEWWITDNIIHFGRCEFGEPVDFEIDVNVKSMPRSDSQTNYATRIYAFGSTRNIPTNYRPVDENIVVNGVVQKRLMLPVGTPYIDAYEDMSEEEAVEDIVIFDDIYPRRIGTASAITIKEYTDTIENEDGTKTTEKWNAYRFKDAGITFSKDYIITGQELRIKFESGLLNGMEFGVTFNPDGKPEKLSNGLWNPVAQLWEIVRNDDYGRKLPDETLKPVAGDTYVLSGFDTSLVSDQYLPAAEQELKEKAQAYVEKTKKDPSTYSCTMSSVYMHNDGESKVFEIGDRVNLINKGYFENGRMSRIIGFEYYLDKPCDSTIYTVGETAAYSRIGEIEDKIDNVTYKGQTYTGGSGSGVYVIRTNDNTIASNSNVLSALRSLSTFLRKDSDDEAAGLITLLKGLNLGQFVAGIAGGNLDAAGNAELNSLIVRLKAEVQSLNVTDSAKIKTLEVLELLKGKVITGILISGDEVKATLVEAIQIIGDNIIANETVAGKNVTASDKVTSKSLVAKENISGVTADILDKTTTLNLLVKNLAEIYDLKVSHVATLMGTIVKEYISSESFVSGFAGEGMKIYKALNGDWNMELDNLTVRKIFSVFELVVQRITHQGGMVIRSAAGGTLTKVTDGGTYWRCEHDSTDDFALNDQIICQAFTGNQAKRYWRLVTSSGAGYFNLSKADCEAGSAVPEAGDEVAVLGNRTNTARQKAQIDCAVGDNAPYRDDYDNINSYSLAGKLITRTGNLSGITDAVFGVLSGSGLYGTNVYLKGTFRLISGKTVEEAISDAQVLAQEYSDNKLTTFKTTTYQSDIQALEDNISLKVSSTTYQQDQSSVTTRLSAAETKITDEAIRLTVKSQTETIAKSAVDGIQVGGRNLWKESSTLKAYPKHSDTGNKPAWIDITEDGITFTRITPINSGNFYFRPFLVPISFKKGDSYTISFQYRTAQVSDIGLYNYLLASGISAQVPPSSEWTSFSKTYIAEYDRNVPVNMLFGFATLEQGKAFDVRLLKLEKGNKATDWTPATEDIENRVSTVETNFEIREGQISFKVTEATTAATNAKQSEANASGSAGVAGSKAGEASNYAGNAKKSADDANVSLLNVIAKESSINQTASSIALQVTEVTQRAKDAAVSATESSNAAELAMAMSKGKMLYRDASFLEGVNGISRYNNNSSTPSSVTLTREQGGINTYQLKIRIIGPAAPGLGGFFFNTPTGPSKIFVTRFIAKFPIGYTVNFATNAFGIGASFKWLTSREGTGKWEEYAVKAVCGDTGTFGTTNFFYLDGVVPTPETPLEMLLSYATVFEVTAAEIDYLADTAGKYTTKTEHASSITQLSNSIELKVAKTDFNALGSRVSSAETTITQHTNSIALKANQSDLNVLGNRVSAAELKITPDAINLTVKSQTETITQKTIDSLSNKIGTQLLPNDWTLGTGGTPFYNTNGMPTENERIIGVNHLGQNVILWSCIPSGNGEGDGGWNTNMVAIDKTKTYRFSVFAKKTKVNGRFYVGPGGDSICSLNTSTKDPNPYFYGNQLVGLEDRWLLFIGYVNPFGLTGLRNNGEIWDCETGKLVGQTSCFNWANDAFQVYHRCYLFYNNDDATNRQYMYAPRIDLVDGNEPSVSQLLGMPAIQSYATDKASQAKQDAIADAAGKYTTKTEFSAQLIVLNNSIATKVSQSAFDQLGNTVSNHTTQLTQLPNTIDARITTQTNEGGIIKTNVESWFTMEGNVIKLGAKSINVSGATVFNSLATQTQAQGYADNALANAKGHTDNLKTSLGELAFEDEVGFAKLDSTIIDGAYIKTTLIKASSITADKLDVDSVRAVVLTTESLQAVRIVTGNIEVTDNALVGGFKVNSYNLANVNNKDCWISVTCNDMYSSRVSSLGNNYPATTGIATAGYFSATGSSRNHALILNATGSAENTDIWGGKSNLAIWATGGVKWKMNQGDHWCMPGVLAVVEIDGWSLALQNRWGNGFSSLGISRGSDKAYAITHNIGHTEYTVLAIPFVTNTDGRWIESIPMYVDKSSTYIKIFFKTGSNDTTLPRYITFVFFGRNGAL